MGGIAERFTRNGLDTREINMASKNHQITINDEQANILYAALQDRCVELERIASGLMKNRLPDAAGPIYSEIKRLQKMQKHVGGNPDAPESDDAENDEDDDE